MVISGSSSQGRAWYTLAALLAPPALFLALYVPALNHGLVWSDAAEIETGTLIRPLAALPGAFAEPMHGGLGARQAAGRQPYYRPLQVVVVSLVAHAFGNQQARPFRVVSLGLGVASVILLTLLARRLAGSWPAAALAGAMLAAHPAGIETYVWVSGLSEALSDLLVIASLLVVARLLCAAPVRRPALSSALSCLFLAAALLAKEKAVITPALVLAAGWLLRRMRPAALARLVAAQGAVVAIYLLVRARVLGPGLSGTPPIEADAAVHLFSTLALWARSITWLLLPLASSSSDAIAVVRTALHPAVLGGLAWVAGSLAAVLLLRRRGHGLPAFGVAFVWLAYLPTSNLVPLLHAHAERYLFLSTAGLGLAATGLAALPGTPAARRLLGAALLLWTLFLAQRTHARLPDWESTERLFRADVARDPRFREGRYYLARAALLGGDAAGAEAAARDLLALFADRDHRSYLRREEAEELYCLALLSQGKHAAALAHLAQLRAADPATATLPALVLAHAHALDAGGQSARALQEFQRVAAALPGRPDTDLCLGLARCYLSLGLPQQARSWLERIDARERSRDPRLDAECRRLAARARAAEEADAN